MPTVEDWIKLRELKSVFGDDIKLSMGEINEHIGNDVNTELEYELSKVPYVRIRPDYDKNKFTEVNIRFVIKTILMVDIRDIDPDMLLDDHYEFKKVDYPGYTDAKYVPDDNYNYVERLSEQTDDEEQGTYLFRKTTTYSVYEMIVLKKIHI